MAYYRDYGKFNETSFLYRLDSDDPSKNLEVSVETDLHQK